MDSLAALFAPLALLLVGSPESGELPEQTAQLTEDEATSGKPTATQSSSARRMPDWLRYAPEYRPPSFNQVRIEQRVILRISPRATSRRDLVANLQARRSTPRYIEQKMGKCLSASSIVGVQAEGSNRLLLFLRDRGLVAANLEKACSSRDFYSGFYIERNDDGNLCIDRDRLLSRNGAKCQVSRLRRLVPEPEIR